MTTEYILMPTGGVVLGEKHIPADPDNADYAEYLAWVADGNEPTPYAPPPPPAPISVTPLQARRALRAAGLYDAVTAAISAADDDIQDAWDYALEVRRDDPGLNAIAAQLGIEDQLDALFLSASTL